MSEHNCELCGLPAKAGEFITLPSGRRWMHPECMVKCGFELLKSGAFDDLTIARPDGPAAITTRRRIAAALAGSAGRTGGN